MLCRKGFTRLSHISASKPNTAQNANNNNNNENIMSIGSFRVHYRMNGLTSQMKTDAAVIIGAK